TCAPGTLGIDASHPKNYTFVTGSTGTLTFGKAGLSVNAADLFPYTTLFRSGFTSKLSGFAFGQSATSAGVTGAASCWRDPGQDAGGDVITCAPGTLGTDASHPKSYAFGTGSTGTLTIGKAGLSVNADDQSKTYGQDDPGFTSKLSGFAFAQRFPYATLFRSASCSRDPGQDAGGYVITCAPGTLGIDASHPK